MTARAPERLSRPGRHRLPPRRRSAHSRGAGDRERRGRRSRDVRGGRRRVEVDGAEVGPEPLTYVLLHKPAGVVTTARDPHGRPTVVGLVGHERRVVPVGRLDADTTGVLLLTNDGPLAHRLMHPRYEVDKVYEVEVEGEPSDEALGRLRRGRRAGRWADGACRGSASCAVPPGADPPRRPQAPGEADARRGRTPGRAAPSQLVRGLDRRRPPPGRMAGAQTRRGRAALRDPSAAPSAGPGMRRGNHVLRSPRGPASRSPDRAAAGVTGPARGVRRTRCT